MSVPTKLDSITLERLRRLLCALQNRIRDAVTASRGAHAKSFAKIAAVTEADTIYQIDKISEAAILTWFEENWPRTLPVELVMEGIEDGEKVTFPRGTPIAKTGWKCILDPIDGTRCIMYDKRSAWSLAGIAPQRGAKTNLSDIVVAAMTELPTTKQLRSDQFSAVRGGKLRATACDHPESRPRTLAVRPSTARDFKHGFASFVRFFPDGRALTAQIEEAVWRELHAGEAGASPLIFDDQYISTGGQLHELMTGRDRLIADIRPLVFRKLALTSSLVCHPYDICTALLLEAAGGVIEAPLGGPVRAPLDTTTPVAWIGFANPHLAKVARPAVRRVLKEFLG
jgi:fructose-1,6-bisphosphatase/inositol monophosphatase family enzyme